MSILLNNNNNGINNNRKRKISYSISISNEWQPCEKPFEGNYADGGIHLGFNYWIENNQILDADITNLVLSILIGIQPPRFLNTDSFSAKSLVIIGVHGIDPITLAKSMDQSPFLEKCSCVPIRHSNLVGNKWSSAEVNCMTSLILWPIRQSVSSQYMTSISISKLFQENSLIFHAENSNWADRLIFNVDASAMTQIANRKPSDASLDVHINDAVAIGRFRRAHGLDTGVFVVYQYSKEDDTTAATKCLRIALMWAKWPIDIMERIVINDHLHEKGNNSEHQPRKRARANSHGHSHMQFMNILVEDEIDENEVMIRCLRLEEAVPRDVGPGSAVGPLAEQGPGRGLAAEISKTGTHIDADKGVDAWLEDAIVEGIEVAVIANGVSHLESMAVENVLIEGEGEGEGEGATTTVAATTDVAKRVSSSVDEATASRLLVLFNAATLREASTMDVDSKIETNAASVSLESLLLSPTMRELMGYPADAELGQGYISTAGYRWRPTAQHKCFLQDKSASEDVEEGEETQDEDSSTLTVLGANVEDTLSICALDCEMVVTEKGFELARLSIVSPEKPDFVVMDLLVKPSKPVLDYNSAYSGITEETLQNVTTSLADALVQLRRYISTSTIIVGHSLDCDLRCLGLVHGRVIDTAALFPHPKGIPFKHGLKKLAACHLGLAIQDGVDTGHDSVQDAIVSMELTLLKAIRGHAFALPKAWEGNDGLPREPLLAQAARILEEEVGLRLGGTVSGKSEDAREAESAPLQRRSCVVHCCPPFANLPDWERHALGFKSESDASEVIMSKAAEVSEEFPQVVCSKHTTPAAAASAAVKSLKDMEPNFLWLDITATFQSNARNVSRLFARNESREEDSPDVDSLLELKNMPALDRMLDEVYAAMPSGGTMLVITQGSLAEARKLISKKQRMRWEEQRNSDCVAVSSWSDLDEEEMIKSCAHILSGAVFLRRKL